MREWIIWGARGHAAVLVDLLNGDYQSAVVACFDNDPSATATVLQVPQIGGEQQFLRWLEGRSNRSVFGAVAIGGNRGRDRRLVARYLRANGVAMPAITHPSASICASATIEEAAQVLALAHVGSRATVGKSCIINTAAIVEHDVVIEEGVHVAPGAVLCGEVHVARDAMLGAGCTVLPGLRIGEGAVVGAGAVVVKDVQAGVTVVGNPAKFVRRG